MDKTIRGLVIIAEAKLAGKNVPREFIEQILSVYYRHFPKDIAEAKGEE